MPDPLDMNDPNHPLHGLGQQFALMEQRRAAETQRRMALSQALMQQQSDPATGGGGRFQMPQMATPQSGMGAAAGGLSGLSGMAPLLRDMNNVDSSKFGRGPAGEGGTWDAGKAVNTVGGMFPQQGGFKGPEMLPGGVPPVAKVG